MKQHMNIGQLAGASGVNAKMIRYYESIGLIAPAERTHSNYRVYSSNDVHLLKFIRRARSLGFSLPEIDLLLSLWQNTHRSSSEVKELALRHIEDLEARILEMQGMVSTLRRVAEHCHGDERPDCPILDDLAQFNDSRHEGEHQPGASN